MGQRGSTTAKQDMQGVQTRSVKEPFRPLLGKSHTSYSIDR